MIRLFTLWTSTSLISRIFIGIVIGMLIVALVIDPLIAAIFLAVGFIISVVQDSVETALNSSGDVMFAATAEFHDRMKRGEKIAYFDKK